MPPHLPPQQICAPTGALQFSQSNAAVRGLQRIPPPPPPSFGAGQPVGPAPTSAATPMPPAHQQQRAAAFDRRPPPWPPWWRRGALLQRGEGLAARRALRSGGRRAWAAPAPLPPHRQPSTTALPELAKRDFSAGRHTGAQARRRCRFRRAAGARQRKRWRRCCCGAGPLPAAANAHSASWAAEVEVQGRGVLRGGRRMGGSVEEPPVRVVGPHSAPIPLPSIAPAPPPSPPIGAPQPLRSRHRKPHASPRASPTRGCPPRPDGGRAAGGTGRGPGRPGAWVGGRWLRRRLPPPPAACRLPPAAARGAWPRAKCTGGTPGCADALPFLSGRCSWPDSGCRLQRPQADAEQSWPVVPGAALLAGLAAAQAALLPAGVRRAVVGRRMLLGGSGTAPVPLSGGM